MSGNIDQYIDLDSLTVKPSPQRIRNILTLEERVAAIKAYSVRPMYTKVAKMFNCSWEQIKNIIANRQAILEFYEATKNAERQNAPLRDEARKRKIDFLGDCVYEYIQRLQFHNKVDITEELIRCKALEFRDLLRIDKFMPDKAWMNQFKSTFNISLSNRQLRLTRAPPSSLDLRDVMTYCTKMKDQLRMQATMLQKPQQNNQQQQQQQHKNSTTTYRPSTMLSVCNENETIADQLRQRRQRKLNFLERALLEYATRAKFHLKLTPDDERLCKTAKSLRDMLKVDNFEPSATWLKSFKTRYDFNTLVQGNLATSTRTPPLSLDLRDILSYCSRLEKNSQIGAADSIKSNTTNAAATATTSPAVSTGANLRISPTTTVMLKNMLTSHKAKANDDAHTLPTAVKSEVKTEIIDLAEDDEEPKPKRIADNDKDAFSESQQPALKIRKIESMCEGNEMSYIMQHSPGHWSEPSDRDINDDNAAADHVEDDTETLPKTVRNYADALKLLKPLEEFAMLEENYRAIGLLEQLESIFKNPPSKEDEDEVDN